MLYKIFFFIFIFFIHSSFAKDLSLCDENQIVFLNAKTKHGKKVSFCMPSTTEDIGYPEYLQYRFGRDNHVELTFPNKYAKVLKFDTKVFSKMPDVLPSDDKYSIETIYINRFGYSGGGALSISFKIGEYKYHYLSGLYKLCIIGQSDCKKSHMSKEYMDIYKEGNDKPISTIRFNKHD